MHKTWPDIGHEEVVLSVGGERLCERRALSFGDRLTDTCEYIQAHTHPATQDLFAQLALNPRPMDQIDHLGALNSPRDQRRPETGPGWQLAPDSGGKLRASGARGRAFHS